MKLSHAAILLVLTLLACGDKGRVVEPKGGDAHMVLMEREYNFGTISDSDGILEHEFVIANDGGKSFVLLDVKPHCSCTTVEYKNDQVSPGYGTKVKVTLDVRAVSSGDFYREIDIIPSCKRDRINGTIYVMGKKV